MPLRRRGEISEVRSKGWLLRDRAQAAT